MRSMDITHRKLNLLTSSNINLWLQSLTEVQFLVMFSSVPWVFIKVHFGYMGHGVYLISHLVPMQCFDNIDLHLNFQTDICLSSQLSIVLDNKRAALYTVSL